VAAYPKGACLAEAARPEGTSHFVVTHAGLDTVSRNSRASDLRLSKLIVVINLTYIIILIY